MSGTLGIIVDITLNSLVLGGVFLIVAIGLNIIYGLSRIMNMAHGALYAVGAYIGFSLVASGLNFFAALLIAPLIVGVIGLIIERTIIAPMRKRSMAYTLILTYGLMFFLDGSIKYIWGNKPRFIELPEFMQGTLPILGTDYPVFRLVTLLLIILIMGALMLFLNKTKIGIILRASSTIPEMVSCLGVNMSYVHMGAFVLGCVMAGLAGIIAGPLTTIDPLMGGEMLISSFVVIVIGGLGSLRGAVIAALLVGGVQTLAEFFITDLAMVIVYILMAVILAFMPRGLLGEGKFE
ncbi:branched-chain amino acid ABC transporter permease [Desulfobacter latus]|uniref:Branched-chain amino acid ABC transporter permease n=1 Tax=Desulfobacter latus TaxID=2292 RepID=A0A850SZ69_9BACT|nr:branched-chain amino acid ABC transporter permease [Desulfobacter latus]NWH04041.1 branched-chain amino acid ABC transporter permease [Desulfobacter latus]